MIHIRTSALSLTTLALLFSFRLGAQDFPGEAPAVLLEYRQRAGDVFHGESRVRESVYVNGLFSHEAVIDESAVSVVRKVNDRGTAELDSSFRTGERIEASPGYLEWNSSEKVHLLRDSRGRMEVPRDAVLPVIRNIPVFPGYPVSPGDCWSARAEEVHFFRIGGGTAGPYRGGIPVSYEYAGNLTVKGMKLAHIIIRYNIYLPVEDSEEPVRLITGRSEQNLYWDTEKGEPVSKSEEFEFMVLMSRGVSQEFRGHGDVDYRTAMELNRDEAVGSIRRSLNNSFGDSPGISVDPVEEGILLSLEGGEELLFQPESALISEDQHSRLEVLRTLLEKYPDRDVLITGHTAHSGTPEGRRRLSEERAAAVASFLFPDGRPGPGKLYLRAAGSEEPAAPEFSEAGRAANRRVEILILD